jgi:hypothetical protein
MKQAYGDSAFSHSWIFEWYARFRDGREDLEDEALWTSDSRSND